MWVQGSSRSSVAVNGSTGSPWVSRDCAPDCFRPSVRPQRRATMTASYTFHSGNEKKNQNLFFFFPTALVEFLRGQFGLRHPSKRDFSFCSRIDFFYILLLCILRNNFFAAPWTCFYVSFPLIRRLFVFSDTTDRAKRRRDGGGKHVRSSFLSLCFLSLLLISLPLSSCFAVFSFLFFFPKPRWNLCSPGFINLFYKRKKKKKELKKKKRKKK